MDIKKKVLLIENSSSDFIKSRIKFANHLQKKGYEVYALVPHSESFIPSDCKIKMFNYHLNRNNNNLYTSIKNILYFKKIINEYNIDIIHSFRFQPNLLNIFANYFNQKTIILHITGLGIAFSSKGGYYRIIRLISQFIFQIKLIRANKVIVQNPDDKDDILFSRFWRNKIDIIKGSGVDINLYNANLYNKLSLRTKFNILNKHIVFVCVSRLIWEKGILEMINAVKTINNDNVRLFIIGSPDNDNPRHVSQTFIDKFKNDANILFLGRKENIEELLSVSDVFIYPSYYREGIPRGILEALSMSLPVITSNTPGCRLTVIEGKNGYLVRPKSEEDIINAISKILNDDLNNMGRISRNLAENEFQNEIIFNEIEEIYR
jgi:glycosyltransferase involved in cell wall biosynthesis